MINKIIAVLVLAFISLNADGQARPGSNSEDKTLSPYFFVKSDNGETDMMPLLKTTANVRIEGVIADVTVTQIYKNTGKKPLEAVYIFPASTRAAVYAMTMTIGKRILKAEIQERAKARATYEKAKSEGRSTSLLEQQKPNVFQMNVANIMAGEFIDVELKYTELLIPESGEYEFVYPTVVGPRYTETLSKDADEREKYTETPYSKQGEQPAYDFDINVSMNGGMALQEISSPSHSIDVRFVDLNKQNAIVSLKPGQNKSGNKDYILKYRLAGDKIQTGLLLSEGEKENYFLLMLQPPKKVKKDDLVQREYIFVIDVSGSMNGYPLEITKAMIRELLNSMNSGDLFNIMLFDASSRFLNCTSVPATKENIDNGINMIARERGSGGTRLLSALEKVYRNPKAQGYSRSIVILTDGYISVEEKVFKLIEENLNKANVYAFGIGTSVNRYLIEGMARMGGGEPFFVTAPEHGNLIAKRFIKYIDSPVMTDLTIEFTGFDAYDIMPRYIADVTAERPILIYGKWRGEKNGKIKVSGDVAQERLQVEIPMSVFAGEPPNNSLKYLWARNKIAVLSDYNTMNSDSNIINEITELGLRYNLLTNYTSFVAVDYEISNENKEIVKVIQPLPLPEGVSEYAVGNASPLKISYSRHGLGVGGSSAAPLDAELNYLVAARVEGIAAEESSEQRKINITDNLKELQQYNDFKEAFVYPERAVELGLGGVVKLWILTDRTGRVVYSELIQTDSRLLYNAAVETLEKVNFLPTGAHSKSPYIWRQIEVMFDATGKTAEIVNEIKIVPIPSLPIINDIMKGSGKQVEQGSKVTFKYSLFNSECECLHRDKTETVIYGKTPINYGIKMAMEGMAKGGKRKSQIPAEFFIPNAKENFGGIKEYHLDIEILDVQNE